MFREEIKRKKMYLDVVDEAILELFPSAGLIVRLWIHQRVLVNIEKIGSRSTRVGPVRVDVRRQQSINSRDAAQVSQGRADRIGARPVLLILILVKHWER